MMSYSERRASFEQTQAFLEDFDHKRPLRPSRWSCYLASVNLIALLGNALLFFELLRRSGTKATPSRLLSDFTRDALEWEMRPLDDIFGDHDSVFRGDPRSETDQAWRELLQGYNIRVPQSVATWPTDSRPNHTFGLVELQDGSGMKCSACMTLIELQKTIRQYLLPEQYPDIYEMFKPEAPGKIGVHMDHCLDMLRQSAMCHGDMSLVLYEWWTGLETPQNVLHTPHQCVNWDRLQHWLSEHSTHIWGDILRHPVAGSIPFPSKYKEKENGQSADENA